MRGTTGLTLSRSRNLTTWKSRNTSQPWRVPSGGVDLWRFALAAPSQEHAWDRTRWSPYLPQAAPLCLAHSHAARLLCSRPWPHRGHQLQCPRAPALQPATNKRRLAANRFVVRCSLLAACTET